MPKVLFNSLINEEICKMFHLVQRKESSVYTQYRLSGMLKCPIIGIKESLSHLINLYILELFKALSWAIFISMSTVLPCLISFTSITFMCHLSAGHYQIHATYLLFPLACLLGSWKLRYSEQNLWSFLPPYSQWLFSQIFLSQPMTLWYTRLITPERGSPLSCPSLLLLYIKSITYIHFFPYPLPLFWFTTPLSLQCSAFFIFSFLKNIFIEI